jgi:hypothetical protein
MPGGMNGGKVMNEPTVPVYCPNAAGTEGRVACAIAAGDAPLPRG